MISFKDILFVLIRDIILARGKRRMHRPLKARQEINSKYFREMRFTLFGGLIAEIKRLGGRNYEVPKA